jgi:hypothetical protein
LVTARTFDMLKISESGHTIWPKTQKKQIDIYLSVTVIKYLADRSTCMMYDMKVMPLNCKQDVIPSLWKSKLT